MLGAQIALALRGESWMVGLSSVACGATLLGGVLTVGSRKRK